MSDSSGRPRLDSLDALRGLVMVVMALDHARDFFFTSAFDPRDPAQPALFLTRWVTHFCAPVFVFLAGTAAFLFGSKRPHALPRFLWTRGLWLVFLELTVVRVAWTFDLLPGVVLFQVIWAIGWAMVALAALARLPIAAVGAIGLAIVAGHDLLNPVSPASFGSLSWLWVIVHGAGPLAPLDAPVVPFALYALLPWIGVIALGYAVGPVLRLPSESRRRALYALGAGGCFAFVVVRALNGYGDPRPWAVQSTSLSTVLSFVNTEKYPPSLDFLLMTLGPSLALLGALDRRVSRAFRPLVTIGRVPLAYYVAHIFLLHTAAVVATALTGGSLATLLDGLHPILKSPTSGFSLGVVYLAWLGAVLALYPFCRWFADVKQRRSEWWISYL